MDGDGFSTWCLLLGLGLRNSSSSSFHSLCCRPMVQLTIVSTRGNAVRWYPVTGFLGLTDVKVEGIVRTRLEDDQRHLAATSIDVSVRCYEERIGKTGPTSRPTVLAEFAQTLWQKQPGRASEPVGDKDLPFHITIPKRNKGASVMNFQTYRVFWRVEASQLLPLATHSILTG